MGKLLLRLAIAVGGVAIVALWWHDTTAGSFATPALATSAFGDLAGLVASFLVCAQLLLIARIPWFERAVGLDRLVSWHRSLGTTVLFLVIVHVAFIVTGQMLTTGAGPLSGYLQVFHGYPDMLAALVGAILFFAVGLSSARLLRRALPYELWYLLHLGAYAAVFLTFFHQLSAGADFVESTPARVAWYALYLGTAACIAGWRLVLPLVLAGRHRFEVAQVVPESERMASVWIRGERLRELGVEPGQFLIFRFLVRGHWWSAHPYSVSNVPDADGLIRISVAALGGHSAGLGRLHPGARVLIEGPFGRFTAQRSRRGDALLVAGGAGIGPIRSLAQDLARRERSVVVLYRASTPDDLALLGELQRLRGVRVVPLVGRRAELGHDPLDPAVIARLVPDVAHRDAYVCGPPGMVDTALSSLRYLGVPGSRLHAEELSFA